MVGPGDELELALFGRVTARVPLTVNAEGSIYVPNLGHVRVGGLTLVEARARLSEEFERRYRGVRADITLLKPRRILVHVAGEVEKPGLVELQAPARVSEAVKAAGGFKEQASRRNLTVERARGAIERADLGRYAMLGLPSENPYLDNGDVVRVPASLRTVEVQGEVAHPGVFEFRSGDRLSGILALAGGAQADADSDSVEVWRFFSPTLVRPLTLPLRAALDSPGGPSDPTLEPDDRIYIRNVASWHRRATVQVIGEAVRPGIYAIPTQGQLASELIARFEGFTSHADINSARVFRPGLLPTRDSAYVNMLRTGMSDGNGEDAEFLKVHALAQGTLSIRLRKLVAGGDSSADFQLLGGDLVTIPTRTGSVAVYGAVRRPGAVDFRHGAVLDDYIRSVGGYGKRADRGRVRVTQTTTGQPVRASDVTSIEDGDLVWVPEREHVSLFRSIANAAAFLAQLSTIYLVIHQATK
jgi:protein involved in polysaccharide export with SLBB domain